MGISYMIKQVEVDKKPVKKNYSERLYFQDLKERRKKLISLSLYKAATNCWGFLMAFYISIKIV